MLIKNCKIDAVQESFKTRRCLKESNSIDFTIFKWTLHFFLYLIIFPGCYFTNIISHEQKKLRIACKMFYNTRWEGKLLIEQGEFFLFLRKAFAKKIISKARANDSTLVGSTTCKCFVRWLRYTCITMLTAIVHSVYWVVMQYLKNVKRLEESVIRAILRQGCLSIFLFHIWAKDYFPCFWLDG